MKKVTDLGENEVIHCPTEREAIAICQLMHDAGLRWNEHESYLDLTRWDRCSGNMCYHPYDSTYCDIDYFKIVNATIHPASDFLPDDFYKVDEAHSSVVIDPVKQDEQPEQMSERKRKSFEFYDQLPEPLRTQAKDNFCEEFSKSVPFSLHDAIALGWDWMKSKHGYVDFWCQIHRNACDGVYKNNPKVMMVSDPTIPSPELLAVYEALDAEGKKIMREKMPSIEWPEVKEYVTCENFEYCRVGFFVPTFDPVHVTFQNCTPEIDHEKGEIRFVKV